MVTADTGQSATKLKRLIVTGVDGAIGANLAVSLAGRFEVLGLYQDYPVSLVGCATARWSPARDRQASRVILTQRPDWIIHCGPLSCPSWDVPADKVPEGEPRICRLLAELADRVGAPLTVISTDAVFTGPRLFHGEESPAGNAHRFAQAARRLEQALSGSKALIVRTHAYGWSPSGGEPGLAEQAYQALAEGILRRFAVDCYATPVVATDLAELLYRAYQRGLCGLYHIAGAERTSQYRFATELAAAFGLRGPIVPEEREPRCADPAERAIFSETSLNTQRAQRDLEMPMPFLREGLERFAAQARNGFRAGLRGGSRTAAA